MEPHIDKVLKDLCGHLRHRFVEPKAPCQFDDWISYCWIGPFFTSTPRIIIRPNANVCIPVAWDFIGVITFSRKSGYLNHGCDFDDTMEITDQSMDYLAICGQMPWLDHWLDKNPVCHLGPPHWEMQLG